MVGFSSVPWGTPDVIVKFLFFFFLFKVFSWCKVSITATTKLQESPHAKFLASFHGSVVNEALTVRNPGRDGIVETIAAISTVAARNLVIFGPLQGQIRLWSFVELPLQDPTHLWTRSTGNTWSIKKYGCVYKLFFYHTKRKKKQYIIGRCFFSWQTRPSVLWSLWALSASGTVTGINWTEWLTDWLCCTNNGRFLMSESVRLNNESNAKHFYQTKQGQRSSLSP